MRTNIIALLVCLALPALLPGAPDLATGDAEAGTWTQATAAPAA